MTGTTIILVVITVLSVVAVIAAVAVASTLVMKAKRSASDALERLGDIPNVEEETERLLVQQRAAKASLAKAETDVGQAIQLLESLRKDAGIASDVSDMQEFGLYQPKFEWDDPERFKEAIKSVRARQKDMIKDGEAATCSVEWTIEGSAAKGRAATKQRLKLLLRAFNGECAAVIAAARPTNEDRLLERITKAHTAINRLATQHKSEISDQYMMLKMRELSLVVGEKHRKQEVREEQQRIKAQMREEEREQKALESERKAAEREEKQQNTALNKALKELGKAHSEQRTSLLATIALLENKVAGAKERVRRVSMAEKTRAGHVYVISNAGSFGGEVFKVGMTRRIDPLERVRELGDASVPFRYDVHAMVYADNAPGMENEMHRRMESTRMNLVNRRREFFRISLDEIEGHVHAVLGADAEFIRLMPAPEYRESLAMQAKREGERLGVKPAAPADRVVEDARSRFDALRQSWHPDEATSK